VPTFLVVARKLGEKIQLYLESRLVLLGHLSGKKQKLLGVYNPPKKKIINLVRKS
jgi:hypothetical protein